MPVPAITARNLGDLVAMTLPVLGEMKFTEIATDIQKHTALPNLLQENRVEPQGGDYIQWRVMVRHNESARNVGLVFDDDVSIPDTMVVAEADWRGTTNNYGILGPELAMNSSSAKIIDLEMERRQSSMISLAELMEANFWGPAVAYDDNVTPWGVKTWITRPYAGYTADGFVGGLPAANYTSIGLSPTTYPRWRSYFFKYTDVIPTDFVAKITKAATFTNFKPPVDGIKTYSTGSDYGYYTNYGVIGPLEELLRASNENLGPDIDKFSGGVLFRRSPMQWVPYLERDTSNPVYGIQWGDFKTFVLPGWWLKQTYVAQVPGRHTMSANHVDCIFQHVMRNRRTSFCGATSETDPS